MRSLIQLEAVFGGTSKAVIINAVDNAISNYPFSAVNALQNSAEALLTFVNVDSSQTFRLEVNMGAGNRQVNLMSIRGDQCELRYDTALDSTGELIWCSYNDYAMLDKY